jgi:uncharacterized protein
LIALSAALLPAILSGSVPAAAVPPPPEQIAANCESPTYASDMLVCGDTSLRALDARMRDAWSALDFAAAVAPGAWVEGQQDWFKRRSLCAFSERHAECLQDAYLERIAVLEALRLVASRPARQGTAAVCRVAPWGDAGVRLRAPSTGALAIEDGDARVLAAATPLRPGSTWTPYVGFSVDGTSVHLAPMNKPIVVCSPYEKR